MSRGVGCRRSSDPALPCQQCRPAAAAPVQPLAWEPLYAVGAALKTKKQTNKTPQTKQTRKTPNSPKSAPGQVLGEASPGPAPGLGGTGWGASLGRTKAPLLSSVSVCLPWGPGPREDPAPLTVCNPSAHAAPRRARGAQAALRRSAGSSLLIPQPLGLWGAGSAARSLESRFGSSVLNQARLPTPVPILPSRGLGSSWGAFEGFGGAGAGAVLRNQPGRGAGPHQGVPHLLGEKSSRRHH